MKKFTILLFISILFLSTVLASEPVITMTTTDKIGSIISFVLKSETDNTNFQIDFGDGVLIDKTIGTNETTIEGPLVGSQTIKIYGENIIYLNCRQCQLTELDVTNNIALTSLNCRDNQLSTLDLSNNKLLNDLYCSNNQLTNLDLNTNMALTYLYFANNQIKNLDVSTNSALRELVCSDNQIGYLDVSTNTALTKLACDRNQLTMLDISKNLDLEYLFCYRNQLTNLDLSKNTSLKLVYCDNNKLSYLDVSKNMALTDLTCGNNQLTTLDVTNNTALTTLNCFSNQFNFNSLPLQNILYYAYSPQDSMLLDETINIGDTLDLSSQLSVNGNTTTYKWKTQSNATLVLNTDYILFKGKTVFLKPQAEKVYCEMTNATFPSFIGINSFKTISIKVSSPTLVNKTISQDIDLYTLKKNLYIDLPGNALISVYKINGKMILTTPVFKGKNIIEIPFSDIYLVRIKLNNVIITRKIIVQ
ncbi:T9SS type A sorting domain-containing protein [Saccharicrinis sp. FJH2]|uniref:T9SS type A sorting domain-containing protein n=1 Tax=Saccharicrinis sp. FJH65 TaxID=3344659 RepID=UPI0035F4872E